MWRNSNGCSANKTCILEKLLTYEMTLSPSCIFCKIIKKEIPSMVLYESPKALAFMDIQPTAAGHALVIPKYHGEKLHDVPDEYLAELLPIAKKIAIASGLDVSGLDSSVGYNVLQNNAAIAHQVVPHVHVHLIPKRNEKTGLIVGWPEDKEGAEKVKEIYEILKSKIEKL